MRPPAAPKRCASARQAAARHQHGCGPHLLHLPRSVLRQLCLADNALDAPDGPRVARAVAVHLGGQRVDADLGAERGYHSNACAPDGPKRDPTALLLGARRTPCVQHPSLTCLPRPHPPCKVGRALHLAVTVAALAVHDARHQEPQHAPRHRGLGREAHDVTLCHRRDAVVDALEKRQVLPQLPPRLGLVGGATARGVRSGSAAGMVQKAGRRVGCQRTGVPAGLWHTARCKSACGARRTARGRAAPRNPTPSSPPPPTSKSTPPPHLHRLVDHPLKAHAAVQRTVALGQPLSRAPLQVAVACGARAGGRNSYPAPVATAQTAHKLIKEGIAVGARQRAAGARHSLGTASASSWGRLSLNMSLLRVTRQPGPKKRAPLRERPAPPRAPSAGGSFLAAACPSGRSHAKGCARER